MLQHYSDHKQYDYICLRYRIPTTHSHQMYCFQPDLHTLGFIMVVSLITCVFFIHRCCWRIKDRHKRAMVNDANSESKLSRSYVVWISLLTVLRIGLYALLLVRVPLYSPLYDDLNELQIVTSDIWVLKIMEGSGFIQFRVHDFYFRPIFSCGLFQFLLQFQVFKQSSF